MSSNKQLVETHLTRTKRSESDSILAEDVEWVEWGDGVPPTGAVTRGKKAFIQNYGDDELDTQIVRMVEENNVVVVEGITRVTKKDGRVFNVRFVNIFELEKGKVKRKTSFGALLKDAA